jgi:DNA-binding MltR family transcriptional regulator
MKRGKSKKDIRLSLFSHTPNSVRTLRKLFKGNFPDADISGLAEELKRQSDRSLITLAASFLDDALAYRISKRFCFAPEDKEYSFCFRFEGPLGTFSSRLEIAALFGIIDDETYQELDIIRELRNACAHCKHPITFDTAQIANVANRLRPPLGLFRTPDTSVTALRAFFL